MFCFDAANRPYSLTALNDSSVIRQYSGTLLLLRHQSACHHAAAFVSATPAGFSTILTMLFGMMRAFLSTGIAHRSAEFAKVGCKLALAGHERGSQAANSRTIPI